MLTFKVIFIFTMMLSMYYGSEDGYDYGSEEGYASDSPLDGYGSDSTLDGYGSYSTQDTIIKNYQLHKNGNKTPLKQNTNRLLINYEFGKDGQYCFYDGNFYFNPENKATPCTSDLDCVSKSRTFCSQTTGFCENPTAFCMIDSISRDGTCEVGEGEFICDGIRYYDPEHPKSNVFILEYIRFKNGSIRSKQGWSAWVAIDGKSKLLGNYQTEKAAAERVNLENLNETKRQEDAARRVNLKNLQENKRQEDKEWLKIEQPLRNKINDLKELAKKQDWYLDKANGIPYDKYLEKVLPLDFKRILQTERDFPNDNTAEKKREHSLTALKSFMEFHFLPLDKNFGFNQALFETQKKEDAFYNKMKYVAPMAMFGVDIVNNQPVVYAETSLTNSKHWEFLKETINDIKGNGIEKIMYYKYRKVLRFVRDKNIETGTIGYTPVSDSIDVNFMSLVPRLPTLQNMEPSKKYELGFRNATPNEEKIETKCQILLLRKLNVFVQQPVVNKLSDTILADTYILSKKNGPINLEQFIDTNGSITLEHFIEKNQIPKDYNGDGPAIEWYTDEPQVM